MRKAALMPFRDPETRQLALVFAAVAFAQGMWYLPIQLITFVLKERFGYSATEVASFLSISTIPWLIKPAYGLLSDCVPLFGCQRKSYLVLNSILAAAAGLGLSLLSAPTPLPIALLYTLMGLGLAFTNVVTDALMVEHGQRMQLTGAFQSVQWAAIYAASVLVGIGGGALTEWGSLKLASLLSALFPLLTCIVALRAVREERIRGEAAQR
jgi:hypothetical protein